MNAFNELRKNFIEFVFEGAELEGLGLTYAKTHDIVSNLQKSKNRYTWQQYNAVKGMLDAYQQIIDWLEKKDEISFFHLKELNILIDFYEELSFAGQLRMKNIVIGGTNYQPPIPNKQNISELINELLNMPPSFENGIKIMAKLSKIQCFNNGNKRTALVFANFLLIKNNLPIIHIKNHEEYIHRLVDYYNDELQLNTFIACVKQMQENQYSNKNSDVSKLIKINMLNRNLTQYQLAKKCGIDSGFLSRIINKKAKLSINVAKKIADVLNINWKDLFPI